LTVPAGEVFGSVATLLNLDLDIVFVDTTSTYFEVDGADEIDQLPELAEDTEDDQVTNPTESGARAFGHSKDHRADCRRW
jgi:predicted GNAT family N-acyltransferase